MNTCEAPRISPTGGLEVRWQLRLFSPLEDPSRFESRTGAWGGQHGLS